MKKIILACFVLLISISIVNAFGVASPYWKDNPLKISPGESSIVNLNLQNMVGIDDFNIKVTMVNDGEGIARLVEGEKNYLVKAGTYDTYVPIEIKIPANSTYRTTEVKIELIPIAEVKGEMVELSTKFSQVIPVEISQKVKEVGVVNEPKKFDYKIFIWSVIWAIIIILIVIFIKILKIGREEKAEEIRSKKSEIEDYIQEINTP